MATNKKKSVYSVNGQKFKTTSQQSANKLAGKLAGEKKINDRRGLRSSDSVLQAAGLPLNPPEILKPEALQPETPVAPEGQPYNIQEGDTLSGIAGKQGLKLQDILKANPSITDPNKIQAGSNLNLPRNMMAPQQSNYQIGLAAANASGVPAPTTMGQAQSQMSQFMPTQEQASPVDDIFAPETGDPFLTELMSTWQDYMNPETQRESLTQEYTKLLKKSGIQGLDTELLNMKNVIEGTEDDIRTEVMKAGGFATDSQVLALTGARNKQLIKNYNTLLETRNSKEQYIDKMMSLSAQDRQEANQRSDRMMDMGFKIMEYRDKMKNNATDAYNRVVQNVGYDGLLKMTNGDKHAMSVIERTLGMPIGGLSQLAAQAQESRQYDMQEKALDRSYKQAQIDNIYSQIGERNEQGTVMVDPYGKVVVKPVEAMKINKELVNSDAYKAIQKGKDSLQFLKSFEDTFSGTGTTKGTGATSAVFSPRKNADLKAKYNATILNLKEFFNLGVLNGPDEAILRSVLPDPTNRSAFLTGASLGIYKPSSSTKAGLDNMKKMIESSLDERFKNLSSQYGDYSSSSLGSLRDLNRSYIQQKATFNPQIRRLIEENPDLDMDDLLSIITQ